MVFFKHKSPVIARYEAIFAKDIPTFIVQRLLRTYPLHNLHGVILSPSKDRA